MTSRIRTALLAFTALGLIASTWALYVHYRLQSDPTYVSVCEVNETVSCQQVLTSQYGSVLGVPVAAGGAIWALLVFMLAAFGLKEPTSETASRVAGYIFVLSTLGLATVFYFGYVSFFVLKTACLLCITMYASVIGTFLLSAGAAGPIAALPSRLGRDIAALVRNPLSAQPRAPEAQPTGATKVLVLKFNDYQCPSCRLAWILYKDIIAKYEKANPGVFVFENRDYPLETECGAGNAGHAAACEAAAAVRMAREKNRDKDLEAALFERQSPSMTRDEVKAAAQQVAQISGADFDAGYAKMLESIRVDVQLGQKLGITGTPTFFLNGIKLPSLRPAYFDAAIDWAIRRAGTGS